MVDFRKILLALLAGALLLATVASAAPYNCVATADTPIVRAEGIAEQMGDVVLVCTGDVPSTDPIVVNIRMTLTVSANITSNIEGTSGGLNVLTSLLLLDEGKTASGYQLNAYTTPLTSFATNQNLYQAVQVSSRELEWQHVTLYAGAGTNPYRTIRLTNVRADASALGSGLQITAHISVTGTAPVPVTNSDLKVADIRQGLWLKVTPKTGLKRCETPSGTFTLSFTEGGGPTPVTILASSFKERGYSAANNNPGVSYFNESGFVPVLTNGSLVVMATTTLGQATQGTRLVAELDSIPAGVSLSVPNVIGPNTNGLIASYVAPPTGGWGAFGTFPNYAGGTIQGAGTSSVSISGGNAAIVYEITASPVNSVSANESVDVPVTPTYSTTDSDVNLIGSGFGALGTFGPVSANHFTIGAAEGEPRFIYSTANRQLAFTIGACRTILLFPYLTNAPGFDTGIAISNTSADPLLTKPQSGACTLNFYGLRALGAVLGATAVQTTPVIPAGGQFLMLLSASVGSVEDPIAPSTVATCAAGACVLPGFQGYMFATCNFQFAHGFAFVSDLGASKLAMGYLALVVPDRGTAVGSRLPADTSVGAAINQGEQLSQ